MELRRYFSVLRRRLWLILVLAIVGGVAGDLATSQKAQYSASATIYIGASSFTLNSPTGLQTGADQQLLASDLIPTYAKMLGSQPIAASAAQNVGFDLTAQDVLDHIKVSSDSNTTLLTLTATDPNPTIAEAIANAVSNAFATKIQDLSPAAGQGSVPSAPAYVFQKARLPTAPLPSKTKSNIVKGALVGLVVAVGLAGVLEYLDVTIKGPSEAEERTGLSVLGVIPMRNLDA